MQRALQEARPSIEERLHPDVWTQKHWQSIYPRASGLELERRALLIADKTAREKMLEIIWLLNRLDSFTSDFNPDARDEPPRALAIQLTSFVANIVATYLRNEPYETDRDCRLAEVRAFANSYFDFELETEQKQQESADAALADDSESKTVDPAKTDD